MSKHNGTNGKVDEVWSFDEFWRELDAETEPKQIEVMGQIYKLPNSLPATLVLRDLRDGRSNRSRADYVYLIDSLYGEGTVEAWAEAGMVWSAMTLAALTAESIVLGDKPEAFAERVKERYKKKPERETEMEGETVSIS